MAHLPTPPPQTGRIWVGQNVRRYREEQGLNIGQLAERVSELGFPLERTQVSKIENGRTNVDVEKLLALATALDVTPDRLLRNPEQLDAYAFDRIYRYWDQTSREGMRLAFLASILVGDTITLGLRLPIDHPLRKQFQDVFSALLHEEGWKLAIERVPPDAPGYDLFIESLMTGRGLEWSEAEKSSETLEEWAESPENKKFLRKISKGGK